MFALDGLTFDGWQRINTGYCPTAGDQFECEVTVADSQPRSTAALFGTVREDEPERTLAFYVRQGGDDSSVVAYGDMARGAFFPRGKKVSLSVGPDGATWTWDGGSDRLSLTPGFARDGVTPLLIGDVNAARYMGESVPAGTGAAMTLHRFRIWRGGQELIHDYVPEGNCLRDKCDGKILQVDPEGGVTKRTVTVEDNISHVLSVDLYDQYGRLTGRRVGDTTVYTVRDRDDIVVYYTLAPGYVSKTPNPISYPKISGNVWIDNVKINAQTKYVKVTVENAIPHVTNVVVSSQTGRAISSTVDGSNTVYEVERWDNISVRYEVEPNYVSLVRNPISYPEISAAVTINGTWLKAVQPLKENIPYRAWDAKKAVMVDCVCTNAIPVTADVRELIDGRWYAVTGTVSCSTISVNGAAHLILCDEATLTADAIANGALTVYGQTEGCGVLTVSGAVNSDLTIVGGNVKVGSVTPPPKNALSNDVFCVTAWISEEGRAGSEEGEAGSEERRGLRVVGLDRYGIERVCPIEGSVYLWLPKGTHRFAVSDGETTNRYHVVVQVRGATVEPLGPIGFFVNGADIGKAGAGEGWFYQDKTLTLTNAAESVLSGWATNNMVQVEATTDAAKIVLSNAAVFATNRAAIKVAQSNLTVVAGQILKTGTTPETLRYAKAYSNEWCVLSAPGVPVTPGATPQGGYPTAEAATNALAGAYVVPSGPVAKVLVPDALLEAYRDMFGIDVTGGGSSWSLEAVLTPTAQTNLFATVTNATRQIPVAAIARLKSGMTTNVTARGCAPGFFYSLYDGSALTNIVADANATNLNVLCGADAKVVFPEVKKPSEKTGFFKVGVGVTDGVGK